MEENENVSVLPLWESCLQKMKEEGITPGKGYPIEFFEQELKEDQKTTSSRRRFGLGMQQIREELETMGLSLRGGEKGYSIRPLPKNINVGRRMGQRMLRLGRRSITLLSNTDRDQLTVLQDRQLRSILETQCLRVALIERPKTIARFVKKHAPRLLPIASSR